MASQPLDHLTSTVPAQRRAAIMALAKARDPSALPALEQVAQSDPAPELRVLADKAIRYIRQHAAPDPAAESDLPDPPAEAILPDARTADISDRDRDLGRYYLDAATNYFVARDMPRTLEHLATALSHDPDIAQDRMVQNMVEQVMDLDWPDAHAILTDETRLADFIAHLGGKQRLTRRQTHGSNLDRATWRVVGLDLTIYGIVAALGALLILLLALAPFQEIIDQYDFRITGRISDRISTLRDLSLPAVLAAALGMGLYQVSFLALQLLFIHLAAVYTQAGDGTAVYLFRRVVPVQTGGVIVMVITALLMLLIPDLGTRALMLNLMLVVETVGLVVLIMARVGDAYAFTVWDGCNALFMGGLMQAVIYGIATVAAVELIAALAG